MPRWHKFIDPVQQEADFNSAKNVVGGTGAEIAVRQGAEAIENGYQAGSFCPSIDFGEYEEDDDAPGFFRETEYIAA